MIYCKICGKKCANYRGLVSHLKVHKITSKEYYDKFLRKNGEGICPVCGRETSFVSINIGYHKFCSQKCSHSEKYSPMFGKHHTEETKKKMSAARKGEKHPNYGKHCSEKTKQKISQSKKGKMTGEENPFYGKHHTEETKKKMSAARKGEKHPMYGKHRSEKVRKKISDANKGKLAGKNHPNYKGGVSTRKFEEAFDMEPEKWKELAQKIRIRDNFTCQYCGKKGATDVHHIIPRRIKIDNSPENLITLCRSCHRKIEYLTDKYLAEGKDPMEIFTKNGVNND
jgi:hypothetical protein